MMNSRPIVQEYATTRESLCAPARDVMTRQIEGDLIIVPLDSGVGDGESALYTLNETAQVIWQQLDGQRTLGEIADALAHQYGADAEIVTADVLALVALMIWHGVVVWADGR